MSLRLQKSAMLMVAMVLASAAVASAQGFGSHGGGPELHGVPPSVTSPGFGGRPGFHGVPPSVTSPGFGSTHSGFHQFPFGTRRRHRVGIVSPFYGGGYYVPYSYPYYAVDPNYVMDPGVDDTMEEEYARPGPTIFDSHGSGERAYSRPSAPAEEDYRSEMNARASRDLPPPEEPVADQPSTVLVFKDGHQSEVSNYAIVGATLYDLSDGRTKKVALAELDLNATVKQNDERGVDFRVPVGVKAN